VGRHRDCVFQTIKIAALGRDVLDLVAQRKSREVASEAVFLFRQFMQYSTKSGNFNDLPLRR
jgi:hypothetical protein